MKNFFDKNGIPEGPLKAMLGALIVVMSVGFTFSPLLIAFLATPPGGNMFSEGGDGGGSAIWLMFMTIPVGFVGTVIGLIRTISGVVQTYKFKIVAIEESPTDHNRMRSHRGIALACLAPVLFLVGSIGLLASLRHQTLADYQRNQIVMLVLMVLELIYAALTMRLILKGNSKVISIAFGIFLALLVIASSLINNFIVTGF